MLDTLLTFVDGLLLTLPLPLNLEGIAICDSLAQFGKLCAHLGQLRLAFQVFFALRLSFGSFLGKPLSLRHALETAHLLKPVRAPVCVARSELGLRQTNAGRKQ